MTAPVVTIGGREVQVIGGAYHWVAPAPLDSLNDGSEEKSQRTATVIVALALVAGLLVLLSAILARNRSRPA